MMPGLILESSIVIVTVLFMPVILSIVKIWPQRHRTTRGSVVIAGLVLVFYTMLASRARYWLDAKKYWKTQNRLTGTIMIGAGVALSVVSRKWKQEWGQILTI